MSIRDFISRIANYYGNWESEEIFENFVREAHKYCDDDLDTVFRLITEARPAKWGAPDLCCLLGVMKNKESLLIKVNDANRPDKSCPVCSGVLKAGRCDRCKYFLGDDIESHKVWWDSFKNGGGQDLRFDKDKIMKGTRALEGV